MSLQALQKRLLSQLRGSLGAACPAAAGPLRAGRASVFHEGIPAEERTSPFDEALAARARIEAVASNGCAVIASLKKASLAFLQSEKANDDRSLSWDDLDLWGVFDGELTIAKLRGDAKGLVPAIALAPWGLVLESLHEHYADLRTENGAMLRHWRARPGRRLAALWWKSAFVRNLSDCARYPS
jgi:hypothetical protein